MQNSCKYIVVFGMIYTNIMGKISFNSKKIREVQNTNHIVNSGCHIVNSGCHLDIFDALCGNTRIGVGMVFSFILKHDGQRG